MTQLFLDGQEVVPDTKSTIKFVRENPLFKKSSTYTYEVELPMGIERNHRFFGNINRVDAAKEKTVYEARLVVDNITILCGIGHITAVTESSVKVQLLGNEASYNFRNKLDNLFIDELDLGDWFWTTWPDGSYRKNGKWEFYPEGKEFKGDTWPVMTRTMDDSTGEGRYATQASNLLSGKYPWVAFPTINETAERRRNSFGFFTSDDVNYRLELCQWGHPYLSNSELESDSPTYALNVQPFVWLMAKKIAKATGFTLSDDANALLQDGFLKRIFIVNANDFIQCNKCLPHWSVNEWWTNLENAFGVVMAVDYASKSMVLRKRKDHYLQPGITTDIHESEDAFTTEIDDETESDISVCNVGFADHEDNPAMNLSEFITDNARVNSEFANITELLYWAKDSSDMTDFKDTIFKCNDGRHFIYADNCGIDGKPGFIEVDMFRPRLTDPEKEVEVELKFVPARFVDDEAGVYRLIQGDGIITSTPMYEIIAKVPIRTLQVPNISKTARDTRLKIDIERILDGEDEESSNSDEMPDVIYIAIDDPEGRDTIYFAEKIDSTKKIEHEFKYPRPLLHERAHAPIDGNPQLKDSPVSLSLIPIQGQTNLASATTENSVDIDTKHRYCIRFLSNEIPDAGHIFLIRNRKFVCERIEVSISQRGIDRLMTGYFYEFRS